MQSHLPAAQSPSWAGAERAGQATASWRHSSSLTQLLRALQDAYKTGIPADAKPVDGKKAQPIGRGIDTIYVGHAKE